MNLILSFELVLLEGSVFVFFEELFINKPLTFVKITVMPPIQQIVITATPLKD